MKAAGPVIISYYKTPGTVFSIRYRYVFILLLSLYSFINIYFTVGEKLFEFYIPDVILFGVLALVVLGVWELNRMVERNLSRLHGLFKGKIHILVIQFVFSLVIVAVVCMVSLELLYVVMGMSPVPQPTHILLLMVFGFRINLFLNCLNAIVFYMNRLKKTELEAEEFKKISAEAQFESLRNQINPHFLFNSFNVLSTLVYKDADTSARFIGQLSNVYRYLLYSQEKKVVPLQDELAFIDSYLFLLKIRFGENIVFTRNIVVDNTRYVAPAVLQMLIENAIKHNVVSKKQPLHILLISDGESITVVNTLQEKQVKEQSSQIGLQNIARRYGFLSDEKVRIERTDTEFKVTFPLLQIDQ
ncbi:sensor histidine kinase [Chryseolinea lacunae]|uniref:Sensor histidine kinase n=1 Tax=Chryseolinea lacunae TaxID=2801331 RepID=A0ABS1KLY0_9BACT|nr:sensor histidine kinase [Chryseolinea lacunae]